MSTPAPPQSPPQQPQGADALALTAAAVLAGAVTVDAASGLLQTYFAATGVPRQALEAALQVVMALPPEQQGFSGPATRNIVRLNLVRRAQFLVASAKRITSNMVYARSHDQSVQQTLADSISDERRFYSQHLLAGWNRMQAAAKVDSAAGDLGLLLGWNTVLDAHTSPECRAASGRNFRADIMPSIGYPGMVHPHCRCFPGPARPGARLLP